VSNIGKHEIVRAAGAAVIGPEGTVATAPPVVRRRPSRQQHQRMSNVADSNARIATIVARRNGRPSPPAAGPARPRTGVAVVACMDARLDVYRILGLTEGDAHVIRNAGATVSEDVLLSLAISQHLMQTREILVLQHVDCAMRRVHDRDLAAVVERDSGHRPPWRFTTSANPRARLEQAVQRIAGDPHLPHTELVSGFLYDERTGALDEVCRSARRIS
jgi:carbonic anhydrase